jgi:hypothetical protein
MIHSTANFTTRPALVVPPPYPPTGIYGCAKPVIPTTAAQVRTSGGVTYYENGTLTNHVIGNGAHDRVYSHVSFGGYTTEGAVAKVVRFSSGSSDVYNITFDHCVFRTPSWLAGDLLGYYNSPDTLARFHDITVTNCWFEPSHLFSIEFNMRAWSWAYNITIDQCTFERCDGAAQGWGGPISMDYGKDDGRVPIVNGVARWYESVRITHNLFYGAADAMIEMRGFSTLAGSESTTRSYFSGNKLGLSRVVQFSCGRAGGNWSGDSGVIGMYFTDNVIDETYNPGGLSNNDALKALWRTPKPTNFPRGVMSHTLWRNNTFNLRPRASGVLGLERDAGIDQYGHGNVFEGNTWHTTGTSIDASRCYFPMTSTTYTNEHFHLPGLLHFASDAVGSGCTWGSGCTHTGGSFT